MAKKKSRPAASRPAASRASSMLRSKTTRKSARPSAPKSFDFPIDKLPPELIHMICVYLKPTDLASLRLVSRLAASIALEYIVPEVHLLVARESFDQLKALAEHPRASKYVTSFFFEADRLSVLSRKHWESSVAGPQYSARIREMRMQGQPCHHATQRTLRTYRRDLIKLSSTPRHQYKEVEMENAFVKYSEFVHFQQDLQQRSIQEKEIADAMKQFPNLKKLVLATQSCFRSWTSKLNATFGAAFCTRYDADHPSDPQGLQQMRSLLLGAHHAGLKAETLQCGLVSWRILAEETETFARMRESMSNIKNLQLEFDSGIPEYDSLWSEPETQLCSRYLEGGRLRDFIAAAPNLEHLQIGFQINEPAWPTDLTYIVGDYHWPSLKTVILTMICTSEDDLVSFCSRHASTLKSLHLTDVGIIEGDWFSAFDRMRKVLTLDTLVLEGRLEGLAEEVLDFELGSIDYAPELKEGIEAYFRGPYPEDELSLDDFLDYYLSSTDDSWLGLDLSDGDFW